ncbi:prepilin-type N-terminal cleavage/methylation domain-containing protein [Candidatus Uhrbacteria bacterium]|nr:prepilin-type N-terminal cleavage/methylation domain-containing protein [Candidatus Uhrbacteria bacterium]
MKSQEVLRGSGPIGFTLVELLVALTIISMTIVGSISLYGRLQVSAQLNEQSRRIISALRTAHMYALSGIGGTSHGIYFDIDPDGSDRVVVYQGSSYATRVQDADLVENFPASLALSLQLSPSATEIIFSRPTGAVNATGTITLTLSAADTRVISVNRLGITDDQ